MELLQPPHPPKSLNLWILDGKVGNATLRIVKVVEKEKPFYQVGVMGEKPKTFRNARAARKYWNILIEYHLLLLCEPYI